MIDRLIDRENGRVDMAETVGRLDSVRKALQSEAHVDLAHHPIHLSSEDDDRMMEGEVADIAAKKLALKHAAAVPGIEDEIEVCA